MGIFGKIKDNINRGGVKIELVAPERVEKDQPNIRLQVRLTATDKPRVIKKVTATLERHYLENSNNNENPQPDVLATQAQDQQFELPLGQPVYLEFELSVSPTDVFNENSAMGQLANTFSNFGNTYNRMKGRSWMHQIQIVADVDGVALDPVASKKIIIDGQEQPHVNFRVEF